MVIVGDSIQHINQRKLEFHGAAIEGQCPNGNLTRIPIPILKKQRELFLPSESTLPALAQVGHEVGSNNRTSWISTISQTFPTT